MIGQCPLDAVLPDGRSDIHSYVAGTTRRVAGSPRPERRAASVGHPSAGDRRADPAGRPTRRRVRIAGRRPQRCQTGLRQRTEHPVRELRQIRLELDRVRAVAIDCQNTTSTSELAAGDGCSCAVETADGAAEGGADAATVPGCSRWRNVG